MTAITIRALIAELSELDLDLPVYLQIDPEGNGFHAVRGVEVGMREGDEHRPDSIIPPEAKLQPAEWCLDEDHPYKTDCAVVYP